MVWDIPNVWAFSADPHLSYTSVSELSLEDGTVYVQGYSVNRWFEESLSLNFLAIKTDGEVLKYDADPLVFSQPQDLLPVAYTEGRLYLVSSAFHRQIEGEGTASIGAGFIIDMRSKPPTSKQYLSEKGGFLREFWSGIELSDISEEAMNSLCSLKSKWQRDQLRTRFGADFSANFDCDTE